MEISKIYIGRVSIYSLLPKIISGVLVVLLAWVLLMKLELINLIYPFIIIGLFFWIHAFVLYRFNYIIIENNYIKTVTGFINKKTVELHLYNIRSVEIYQGLLGRIFNYGDILITVIGYPSAIIQNVAEPEEIRNYCLLKK